ncbi:MAG: TonB-dependent receptor [Candidatus Eisenbacteria bacterium]
MASGEAPRDLAALSLEELMEIEVVYAASLHEQSVREAPSSVTIVTAEEIRCYGYRTLADLLDGAAGFYTSYDRNYVYLGTRGFSRPGDYNTRILLTINGRRLNDEIYGQASIGTEFPLDIDLIDRVEVIRGPSSSIYGTNAFFAVVNVLTKEGRDLGGGRVGGKGRSFGTYGTGLAFGGEHSSGASLLLSGSYYDSEGRDLYYPEFDDPATNGGVAEGADRDGSKSAYASLSRGGVRVEGLYGWRKKGIPTGAWETAFNDSRTHSVDERAYLALSYTRALGSGVEVSGEASYDWYGYDGDYVYELEEEGEPSTYVSTDYVRGEWWRGDLSLSVPLAERHRLMVGARGRYDARLHQKFFDEEATYLDDERTSGSWAFFAQDEVRVRDDLLVNAGVRHDHYETFGGTTNPRLALIWSPLARTTFKLLYGSAFRAPNPFELYYTDGEEGDEDRVQKPNPDLSPEKLRTYELVLEQGLGARLQGSAAVFRTEVSDLISIETDPDDSLLVFRNLDEAHATGLEIGLSGSPRDGCRARLSYTYQESDDCRTGELLSNSPKHLAKLGIVSRLLGERLAAGFELRYTGDRKTPKGDTADGYVVGNLTLSSRLLRGRLELSASAYNLFDKTYFDPGSEEHVQDLIEQDGRSFGVAARVGF